MIWFKWFKLLIGAFIIVLIIYKAKFQTNERLMEEDWGNIALGTFLGAPALAAIIELLNYFFY